MLRSRTIVACLGLTLASCLLLLAAGDPDPDPLPQTPEATTTVVASRPSLKLAPLFANDMVLQRDRPIPIWGQAPAGEQVMVKLLDQQVVATADRQGRWLARLGAVHTGGPHGLTVESKSGRIQLRNIMIGEVWLCAGQSNMEWSVRHAANPLEEIPAADHPRIRVSSISPTFLRAASRPWAEVSPRTVPGVSAVAYFFARELRRELGDVPIGLVIRTAGGTTIRQWTPTTGPAVVNDAESRFVHEEFRDASQRHAEAMDQYKRWLQAAAVAQAEGLPVPRAPRVPPNPAGWGAHFQKLIAPLSPFAIRGVLWYQGETDARSQRCDDQRRLLPAMIRTWRATLDAPDLPFITVQLANDWGGRAASGPSTMPALPPRNHHWPYVREAQAATLSLPNTSLVVTIDLGGRIHFPNKQDVGRRAALVAAGMVYGRPAQCMGPVFHSIRIEDGRARIHFTQTNGGLVVKDGQKLWGFTIAGEDRQFHWADAWIDGDTVVVSNPSVSRPVAVRYAWMDDPQCNLYNHAGLPAMPFRTDAWAHDDKPAAK